VLGENSDELQQLASRLPKIDWTTGDEARGKALFQKRQCANCHGGRSALGPDLAGVAGRFSRHDLFTAIVAPSRDVSARYQTTILETHAGKVYSGLIVYESVDGLLLRNATNQTFRIEGREIASKRKSPVSIMPTGLLKDLTDSDLADLDAYLRSLTPTIAGRQEASPSE
jgi:putative heme-binding domain-containing protein